MFASVHSLHHVNLAQQTALQIRFRSRARTQYDGCNGTGADAMQEFGVCPMRRCKRDCAVMTPAEGRSGACIFWAPFFTQCLFSSRVRVLHPHSRKTLTKLLDEARTNAPSLSAMLGPKIWNHPQTHGRQAVIGFERRLESVNSTLQRIRAYDSNCNSPFCYFDLTRNGGSTSTK
jgi:hypothetical protein